MNIWLRDDLKKGFPGLEGLDMDWYCGCCGAKKALYCSGICGIGGGVKDWL